MPTNHATPETLEDLRRLRAKTQADLGEQGVISDLERGLHLASASTIRRLAKRLRLPVERVSAACLQSYQRAHATTDTKARAS